MICENCGKEHNGNYGSGRFCCEKCAKSFSTKFMIKGQTKNAICKSCGKEFKTSIYSNINNVNCDECRHYIKRICKVCGREYNKHEGCPNEFCHKHNLQQIKTFIKYFGFDKTKLGTFDVELEFNRIRNIIYDMYWNKNMSGKDIADYFNYPSGANIVGKILIYLKIPRRSFKDCSINAYLTGNNVPNSNGVQYKCEWHTSWNNKEVYLRSSYELDYAKELDKQRIDYDCECLRIKYLNTQDNEYHCAIPDFYLKDTNTIVEIKSSWTLDIQNMKDKFKAYKELGYNCKLILDHKEVNLYELKFE